MERLRRGPGLATWTAWLVAAALSAAPPAPAEEVPLLDAPGWLHDALRDVVETHQIPGIAVALVDHNGATFRLGLGHADRATGRAMTPATPFRVLSLTKPMVAVATMRLVERGRLRLEDRVRDHLPELPLTNPWAATHPLRVVHLLEHSSGLDDFDFDEIQDAPEALPVPLDELVPQALRHRRLRWPPGTRQAYGNPGYALLGLLLERASGRPLPRLLQDEVFRPLGMPRASLGPRPPPDLAAGYAAPGGEAVPFRRVHFWPAAGAMVSADELARLVRLLLGRGRLDGARVLEAASVTRLERRETGPAAPAHAAVGFAKGLYPRVNRARLTHGHYGGGYAYMAAFRYSPRLGRGYVVVQNCSYRDAGFEAVQRLLFQAMVEGAPPPPPPPSRGPRRFSDATLVGLYRHASPRHARLGFLDAMFRWRRVEAGPGGLRLTRSRRGSVALEPRGAGAFSRPGAPGPGLVFTRGEHGELLLLDGRDTFVRAAHPLPVLLGWLLVAALATALLGPPVAALWGTAGYLSRRARRRGYALILEPERPRAPATLPVAASLTLFVWGACLYAVPVHAYGQPTAAAWLAYLASLAYPPLAIAGAFHALGPCARRLPSARAAALAGLALAHAFLGTCVVAWGLMGLKVF